jgi:hypothetical protein
MTNPATPDRAAWRDPHTLSATEQRNVPASVEYFPGHCVYVSHSLGTQHENFIATCQRLRLKGYTVLSTPPTPGEGAAA